MDHSDEATLPPSASSDVRSPRSLLGHVRLVSLCTLLSRVLGLVREMAMAWLFGAGTVSDAFTLAFRIPNLFRQLLGEGALTTAFLPRFVQELEQHGPAEARKLSSGVLVVLTAILFVLVLTAEAAIGLALALGSWSERTVLLLQLLAILLPYLLVICLSAQLCAVLQSLRMFFWPAMIPVLLNVAWIASTFLAPWTSTDTIVRIRLVAGGVVVGGIVQLLIPYVVLARSGYGFTAKWRETWSRVRSVFLAMLPVLLGVLLSQANTLTDTLLAWVLSGPQIDGEPPRLASGTASALYYGYRLLQFPLGVFGVALGTVLFPVLTRSAKRGEWEGFRRQLGHGLEMAIAIGLPASVALVQLAEPLTRVLFQRGNFDPQDAALTSRMIVGYGVSVWASIALLILNRAFYAVEDRLTPVRLAAIAVAANLVLSVTLVFAWGGEGLAWAMSMATVIQLLMTWLAARARFGAINMRSFGATVARTVVASIAMAVTCQVLRSAFAGDGRTGTLGLIGICVGGGAAYLAMAWMVGLTHPMELLRGRGEQTQAPE